MNVRSIIASLALLVFTPAALAAGLGWQVTDEHDNRLIIVGTVHAATADFYPLPEGIVDAFEASEVLVLELDPEAIDPGTLQRTVRRLGILSNRESLRELLPAETWAMVEAWSARLSVPIRDINRMRPWLAANTLVSFELARIGVERSYGMEPWLVERAKERGMPIEELETIEDQFGMLAALPLAQQVEYLKGSLVDEEEFTDGVTRILESWRDGDTESMTAILMDAYADQETLYEATMRARNHAWMPRLTAMLESGRQHYVAVGALHLVGPDGLVELFERAGYRVERID